MAGRWAGPQDSVSHTEWACRPPSILYRDSEMTQRGRPPKIGGRKQQISIALSPNVLREVERRLYGNSRSATIERLNWKALEEKK